MQSREMPVRLSRLHRSSVGYERDRRSPDSFGNLGERELFQVTRVTVKFADAFGELFRGHYVLVVRPAEGLLVQVEAFFFSRLRSYQMTTGWQHALTLTLYSFGRLAEIGN